MSTKRDTSNRIGMGSLLLVMLSPLAFSTQLENGFGLPKFVFLLIAAGLALPGFVSTMNYSRLKPIWPLLAWFSLSIAVTLLHGPAGSHWSRLATLAISALLFLTFMTMPFRDKDRLRIVNVCLVVAGFEALFAVFQWGGFDPLFGHVTHTFKDAGITQRMIGTIGYQNTLGQYLVLMTPLLLFRLKTAGNRNLKGLTGVTLLLMATAIILIRSRGVWVAGLVSSLVFTALVFKVRNRKQRQWVAGSLALIALLCAGLAWMTRHDGHQSITHRLQNISPALQQRILIWKATFEMVKDKPVFGHGAGSFQVKYLDGLGEVLSKPENRSLKKYAINVKESHNDFLQMIAETGVIGGLLWVTFLIMAFSRIYKHYTQQEHASDGQWWYAGLLASLSAFVILSLVSFPLHVWPVAAIFWALLGLGLHQNPDAPQPHPKNITAFTGVSVGAFIIISILLLHADRRFLQSRTAVMNNQIDRAQRLIDSSVRLNPFNSRYRFFQGSMLLARDHYKDAHAAFNRSAAGFTDINLWWNQARTLQALGRNKEGIDLLRRAEATGINPDEIRTDLALRLLEGGNPEEAVSTLQQIPLYKGNGEKAILFLARYLIENQQSAQAIKLLHPLVGGEIKKPKERVESLDLLGVALMMTKAHHAAETYLQQAVRLDPDNVSVLNNLGAALMLQGQRKEAVLIWQRVLRTEPNNLTALKNIGIDK